MNNKNMLHKPVLVLGLGRSGFFAAKLAVSKGYPSVSVYDDKDPSLLEQERVLACDQLGIQLIHSLPIMKEHTLVVASPGVNLHEERFKKLMGECQVISEIEFAWKWMKGHSIAVTGTNGKSTVTALLAHLFNHDHVSAVACGNFGTPLSEVVLDQQHEQAVKVVELSSFQLQYTDGIHPLISLCLEITQDHLDRHPSYLDYQDAKLRLFRMNSHQSHWILHDSIPRLHPDLSFHSHLTRVSKDECVGEVHLRIQEDGVRGDFNIDLNWNRTALSQPHNRHNCLFALSAILLSKKKFPSIEEAMYSFRGLPYRQEKVEVNLPFKVINDSKSTTPDSTVKALEAFQEKLVLIMGGKDKGTSFDEVKRILAKRKIKTVLFGESAEKLERLLTGSVPCKKSLFLKEAVQLALEWLQDEKLILFSPGCVSFDHFKSYADRGENFNRMILELSNKGGRVCKSRLKGDLNSGVRIQ
ncbi:MAG: UDP-N-acetylmuramoyl-L-alanine--D-glutamate ligase [Candidatus Aureabacteria bacterium]|nr:UDP-N-acetylmuramoyl-L-alanine--D-glutamate ligase [Candidatus Auribacterota bacterium]